MCVHFILHHPGVHFLRIWLTIRKTWSNLQAIRLEWLYKSKSNTVQISHMGYMCTGNGQWLFSYVSYNNGSYRLNRYVLVSQKGGLKAVYRRSVPTKGQMVPLWDSARKE